MFERMRTILSLDAASAELKNTGGKAYNLSRLARAGFPVPPGFFVTTGAYQAFVEANHLDSRIPEFLEGQDLRDPAVLEKVSKKIRKRFTEGRLPVLLMAEIQEAYTALGQPPVAVRSSATAEDLPDMSFAGQQDPYLNIIGKEDLITAIMECWGSLWTARAIGYRARNGIPYDNIALAVVVQEMVPSEVSGVLFTANPLNGLRREMVIDATYGLGEALVGGHVEPDHFVIDTQSQRVKEKQLGRKGLIMEPAPEGGLKTVTENLEVGFSLTDREILELAGIGLAVQNHYGAPQDIEWAWAKGRFYLLQSRPITSLYPLPRTNPEQTSFLFSFAAVQGLLDPLTPLGIDAIRLIMAGGGDLFGYQLDYKDLGAIKVAGERIWADMTPILRNRVGKKVLPRGLRLIEPSLVPVLEDLRNDPRFQARNGSPGFLSPPFSASC